MIIREINDDEIGLLSEFLYEAIYQSDSSQLVARTIIQDPSLWVYVKNFKKEKDDYCLVAIVDELIIGAVWVRCINGYGHIDADVPEFAISVYKEYRNRGIGYKLMSEMLKYLKEKGYAKTSLAVQKDNYALGMYQKLGFVIHDETKEEYIMICELN